MVLTTILNKVLPKYYISIHIDCSSLIEVALCASIPMRIGMSSFQRVICMQSDCSSAVEVRYLAELVTFATAAKPSIACYVLALTSPSHTHLPSPVAALLRYISNVFVLNNVYAEHRKQYYFLRRKNITLLFKSPVRIFSKFPQGVCER